MKEKNEEYTSPNVEVVEVEVEQGFAQSQLSSFPNARVTDFYNNRGNV